METNRTILQEYIDRIVLESVMCLTEKTHSVDKKLKKKEKEAKKTEKGNLSKKHSKKLSAIKRKVKDKLNDPMTNDAEIMRYLWDPDTKDEEDILRSEFSKKKREVPNDNGSHYHFTDLEYVKMWNKMK